MGNIETANSDINRRRRKIFDNISRKSYSPVSNLDLSSNRIYLKNFKNVRYPSPILSPLTERTEKKIAKPFLNKSTIITSKSVKTDENTPKKVTKVNNHDKQIDRIQQQKLLAEIQSDCRIQNILCPAQFTKNISYQQKIAEQQNRERCKDIIKKVRNFNEFLNQVKKRIKYESEKCNSGIQHQHFGQQQKNTYKSDFQNNQQPYTIQDFKRISTKKSLNLALKLQNQRIQLQKYKKLLQRELSKQNIVQNITVQNSQDNQKHKILTIKYESKKYSSKSSNTVKEKYNQVVQKVGQLGKQLDNLNDQHSLDSCKSPSTIEQQKMKQTKKIKSQMYHKNQPKIPKERINKIQNLFQKVQEIQQRHYSNCSNIAKCLDLKKQQQSSSNDQELY